MKKRYFLELAYCGTNFHGWQVQKNAHTVQEAVNNALTTILGEKIDVVGAGRTDTGVHAKQMFCHFDSPEKLENIDIIYKLNSVTVNDIAFYKCIPVDSETHARFSAISRTYEYHIVLNKNPFMQNAAWRVFPMPDFKLMNKAAHKLFDYHDFSAFSKSNTQTKTNLCNIMQAKWEKVDEQHWVFKIKADRFLRNMVRAIVGTLVDIGQGKADIEDMDSIIRSKDRSNAGASVPAHGLYLTHIEYPHNCLILPDE